MMGEETNLLTLKHNEVNAEKRRFVSAAQQMRCPYSPTSTQWPNDIHFLDKEMSWIVVDESFFMFSLGLGARLGFSSKYGSSGKENWMQNLTN